MPHPDGYFALVLSREASEHLRAAFATLPNSIAHHCTVRHGTSDPADLPAYFSPGDLGRTFSLVVVGVASSPHVEAVAVALMTPSGELLHRGFSHNTVAHVTIATDGATEPFMANPLLETGFTPIEDGMRLDATLAHVPCSV